MTHAQRWCFLPADSRPDALRESHRRAVAELRVDVVRLLARAQRVGAVRRRSDPANLDALRAAANALWTPRPAGSVELCWSALRTGT